MTAGGADRQLVVATKSQRLDQWLCNARFAKSRTLAQALVDRGKIRINRLRVDKPSHTVRIGDVITMSLGPKVRVVEVLGCAEKRRSATLAAALYAELTAPGVPPQASPAEPERHAFRGGDGRPTKRDRRLIQRLKPRFDDD